MIRLLLLPYDEREGSRQTLLRAARPFLPEGAPDPTIAIGAFGKPFFPEYPDLRFSLSHSADLLALAFCDREIGIDIQKIKPLPVKELSQRRFHPQEAAYVGDDPARFFAIWTAKEAVVKRSGRGFGRGFSAFSVLSGDFCLLRPPCPPGFALCLCAEKGQEVRLLPEI